MPPVISAPVWDIHWDFNVSDSVDLGISVLQASRILSAVLAIGGALPK